MSKVTIFLLFFVTISACSTGQNLRVKRLALIDDNGVERVVLTTGSTHVQMNGRLYKRRSPGSGIILNNSKGDETGGIGMLDDGTISLTLDGYSKDGVNERVSMYVFPDGKSGILVKDTKGNVRARIGVDENMNTKLELAGADEKSKISAIVTPDGKATFIQPTKK